MIGLMLMKKMHVKGTRSYMDMKEFRSNTGSDCL